MARRDSRRVAMELKRRRGGRSDETKGNCPMSVGHINNVDNDAAESRRCSTGVTRHLEAGDRWRNGREGLT
jgi:hypothetical protein